MLGKKWKKWFREFLIFLILSLFVILLTQLWLWRLESLGIVS